MSWAYLIAVALVAAMLPPSGPIRFGDGRDTASAVQNAGEILGALKLGDGHDAHDRRNEPHGPPTPHGWLPSPPAQPPLSVIEPEHGVAMQPEASRAAQLRDQRARIRQQQPAKHTPRPRRPVSLGAHRGAPRGCLAAVSSPVHSAPAGSFR